MWSVWEEFYTSMTVLNICIPILEKFVTANYLKHLDVHSEEKSHLCTLCGKSFSWMIVLNYTRKDTLMWRIMCVLSVRRPLVQMLKWNGIREFTLLKILSLMKCSHCDEMKVGIIVLPKVNLLVLMIIHDFCYIWAIKIAFGVFFNVLNLLMPNIFNLSPNMTENEWDVWVCSIIVCLYY